uniref:HMA domain-containing protein n=1 Tax=Zea mays TaxID=4577 RepID=A0A804Q1P6_MAIZE
MFLHQQKQTWEQLSRELEAKEDRVAAIVKEAFRNLTTRAKEDQARDQGCREGSRRSPGSSGEYLERQPMVQPHKAIASASPMSHVPVVPRTHRHDDKKGWQQEEEQQRKAVVVGNAGGFVSPAGSSRYLLTGRFAATEEIQEVESAPAVDSKPKREEAGEAADAKSAQAQEQVVVLKVSMHCKACARKVKKHLSKMEGEPSSYYCISSGSETYVRSS